MFIYSYFQLACGSAHVLKGAWAFQNICYVIRIACDERFNIKLLLCYYRLELGLLFLGTWFSGYFTSIASSAIVIDMITRGVCFSISSTPFLPLNLIFTIVYQSHSTFIVLYSSSFQTSDMQLCDPFSC